MEKTLLCASFSDAYTRVTAQSTPQWAAGWVVDGGITDRAAAASFFNPYVPGLLRQLLHFNFERAAPLGLTNLVQEPVPAALLGRTAAALLEHQLTADDSLLLAMYRAAAPAPVAAPQPFLVTNPAALHTCVLRPGDHMLLLRHRAHSPATPAPLLPQMAVQLASL